MLNAQEVRVEKAELKGNPPVDWGIDNTLLANEPIGPMSGVQNNNGTIYVAVNDTLSTVNLGLVVYSSTDDGNTWSLLPQGINVRERYEKVKMIKSFADSVYCFFLQGTQVYAWNIISGNFNSLPGSNYRTFDVVSSSTGALYAFLDSLPTNSIIRHGSINGGSSWSGRGIVTSAGAMPKVYMSATGDTLILNYYGPVLADTATSNIRAARYVQTGPGTLASSGFQDVDTTRQPKYEFASAINNGEVWFVYTTGAEGSRNINARKSSTNGVSYDPVVTLAGNVDRDEYWFDIKHFNGGFNLIFYSDSAQAGLPNNESDILYHISVNYGSSTFSAPERISEVPPVYSARGYSPQIVRMPFSNNDVGVLWVGEDAGNRKIYWDVESWIIPVELVSFTALVNSIDVTLNWITASEVNNSGFEIERSKVKSEKSNVPRWEKIGFVSGNGTTTETKSYSFTDNNLSAGSYSYRLKQIDFNGSFEYSNIIEVEVSSPQNFELSQNYPNPFNPTTTISFSLPQNAFVTLKVYDVLGNEIATLVNEEKSAGKYIINFDATSLSSGIYFYSINAGTFNQVKKMTLIR